MQTEAGLVYDASDSKKRHVLRSPNMMHLELDNQILVQFAVKKVVRFYVGRVIQLDPPDVDEVVERFLQSRLSVMAKEFLHS